MSVLSVEWAAALGLQAVHSTISSRYHEHIDTYGRDGLDGYVETRHGHGSPGVIWQRPWAGDLPEEGRRLLKRYVELRRNGPSGLPGLVELRGHQDALASARSAYEDWVRLAAPDVPN